MQVIEIIRTHQNILHTRFQKADVQHMTSRPWSAWAETGITRMISLPIELSLKLIHGNQYQNNFDPGNGLALRCQAIIWTNDYQVL